MCNKTERIVAPVGVSGRRALLRSTSFSSLIILALVSILAGCVGNNQNVSAPPANSAQNAAPPATNPAPAAPTSAPNSNVPVTLPLVDALLGDESFANQAKSSLQLSDEQIQKLKDAARNAVLNLNENGSEDDSRSTAASVKKAEKEIKSALGDEKGAQFISLAQQQMAGTGSDAIPSAQPNSVPNDTRIVVNIPGYRMDIFQNGQLKKTYKIGIGYPEFPLPTGLRKADTIIFNPTWTPPDETWVKGKFQPGKKVEAGSKDNPLGPIKIPIGLPSLIHGGKAPARLGTFASHGCVGLTNGQIQDVAIQLSSLTGPPLGEADVKQRLAEKTETKQVKLNSPIPVELRYETIVVEDGKLKIFRDVYERGTNNEDNLHRVLQAAGVSLDDLNGPDREKILAGLKQMAYDALGNPVDENATNNDNNSNKKNAANSSGKVTKNIKGQKEIVFELPQLKGKGYPAPVNLSSQ